MLLSAGSLVLWGWASGYTSRLRVFASPLAVASFAAVALPWYLVSAIRTPEFVEVFLISHNLGRFLTPMFRHEQPFWFFGPILILGVAPWCAFLLAGLRRAWRAWLVGELAPSPSLYVASWALFPIFFFSLSQSKLPGYILPAVPPAALLLARTVARVFDHEDRAARWPLLGTAAVLAGLAVVFAIPGSIPELRGAAAKQRFEVSDARGPWRIVPAHVISSHVGL